MSHIARKGSESWRIPAWSLMFSLFLRPISPHDVQLYALRDEIEHSKRFYLSLFGSAKKSADRKSENKSFDDGFSVIWFAEWCRNPRGFLQKIKYVFAFSTVENRLCRTLVRRRGGFLRFCIFFISPHFGKAKKAQTEKALGKANFIRNEGME